MLQVVEFIAALCAALFAGAALWAMDRLLTEAKTARLARRSIFIDPFSLPPFYRSSAPHATLCPQAPWSRDKTPSPRLASNLR